MKTFKMAELYYKGTISSQKLIAYLRKEKLNNENVYKNYHGVSDICKHCSNKMNYSGFKNGYKCTVECGHNRLKKHKINEPISKNLILNNVTKMNCISRKFINNYKISEQDCYNLVYGTKKCNYCENIAIFINWANGYENKCNSKQCSKKQRADKTSKTNLERYGVRNVSECKTVQIKKHKTFKNNYGVDNISQLPYVQNKIRKTNENNGRWTPLEKLEDKRYYEILVRKYTEKQNIKLLKNNVLRGPVENNGYHLDHIYSISEGFKNNIPIHIIADINNLRFIPARENQSKNYKCHITIDEIINNMS
jgi:hypothetical protein